MRERGYLPIEDYGVVGNLRTVALVGRDGSIDWCCFPELDDASAFAALLDHRKGGRFRVAPVGGRRGTPRYRGDTCVLETTFEAEGGRLTLTDFMPLRGSITGTCDPETTPEIHRLLHCEEGEVEVQVEWSPRFDYARAEVRMERLDGRVVARAGRERMALAGVPGGGEIVDGAYGPEVRARLRLRAGERAVLVTRYSAEGVEHAARRAEDVSCDLEESLRLMRETLRAWEVWAHENEERPTEEWAGEWAGMITRSELTLKLLTHPGTGAIAAAPTTSLPEEIGGVRNWDYRFCWVRDSIFVVQALYAMGHDREAHDFLRFLQRATRFGEQEEWGMQIMYGIHGETELPEITLDHLEGYRGSRPVRIGNAAAAQRQHDTYGELLDGAYELVARGEDLEPGLRKFLVHLADRACGAWKDPDHGIWEVRSGPRHFTHSKIMVWVALDRAVRLAEAWEVEGDVDRWRRTRDHLHGLILRRGYDPGIGAFTQSFGSRGLDATGLLIPLHEFLPAKDPRVQGTIDRIRERLGVDELVYRYRADDGLPGGDGAFAACSFWLVSALAVSERVDEAREVFTAMLGRASPLGLYAEEIDPRTGEFRGNFPQAFTHLDFISAAMYLAYAEGRPVPYAGRLREIVQATRSGVPGRLG